MRSRGPSELLDELPLSPRQAEVVLGGREGVTRILDGEDDRLLVVVGPVQRARPRRGARLRATGWRSRPPSWATTCCIAMRVYFEKPRTTTGLEGADQRPPPGRLRRREHRPAPGPELLLEVLELGLPVGCEFLDPITPQYISDTVSWGAIGARTTESQIHRQLGSGLSMPIGFKNGTDGNVQVAVDAVRAAAARHAFTGVDPDGTPAILRTTGNPDGHVILRGGRALQNYGSAPVADALAQLGAAGLPERVVIDASHDNSGKDPARQPAVAADVAGQVVGRQPRDRGRDARVLPGGREAGPGRAGEPDLRPVDHRRLHGLGHHRRGARRAGGRRPGAARHGLTA